MRNLLYIIGISVFLFTSCEELVEPEINFKRTKEQIIDNPDLAEGVLMTAYVGLPGVVQDFTTDMATDDATSNATNGTAIRIGNGEVNSQNSLLTYWNAAYRPLFYVNDFLSFVDQVKWDFDDPELRELHRRRNRGEALGLRAYFEMQLLRYHAGVASDGSLLGYVIDRDASREDRLDTEDFGFKRSSYVACVDAIVDDCDEAISLLPLRYADDTDLSENEQIAQGKIFNNRISGLAVHGIKSRVLLQAASPAFTVGESAAEINTRWEAAAEAAGNGIEALGGLVQASSGSLDFYLKNDANGVLAEPEIMWSSTFVKNANLETNNYPPSETGFGRVNPSQDLVDAFPDSAGVPIASSSDYDPNFPYEKRDPRLKMYILVNGEVLRSDTIWTFSSSGQDAPGQSNNASKTGYYLKKFLNPRVRITQSSVTTQNHFLTHFRATEVLLNYAEAANEIGGPTFVPTGFSYSAVDVLNALRDRAGIVRGYIDSQSGATIDDFRDIIHNERRLELCFEGHRYWDLRRWNDTDRINKSVDGINISGTKPNFNFTVEENVQTRSFLDHMVYGPIPFDEISKTGMRQNRGY